MINLDRDQLLFYDVEVFSHDAFVVFMDIDKNVKYFFHNTFESIGDLVDKYTLVGFNNYHYDDAILTGMMAMWGPEQLRELNDKIIFGDKYRAKVHPSIKSLDMMQQLQRIGLKKIEGNMGKRILESGVSFDIDRPLTAQELQESIEYCEYDVATTIDVFELREKEYLLPKKQLLELVPPHKMTPYTYRWNTTTLSAHVLLDKPLQKWSGLRVPEEMFDVVPPEVRDMWFQVNEIGAKVKKKETTITDFNNKITFGFGGLHGVHKRIKRIEKVKHLDVASMYPTIIENLGVLGGSTELYAGIKRDRIKIKKTDPLKSNAMKLILNSVYGLLNNQYSALHNPRATDTVCIYGQISLYDLCKRLSTVAEVINVNTDGVVFKPYSDDYIEIARQWEKDYNMILEEDDIALFHQKDVNNLLEVDTRGHVTARGSDIGKWSRFSVFVNAATKIVDIAMVQYLAFGKDVIDTLLENVDKPELFQYILQAGPTYVGVYDEAGVRYNKINRIFATKQPLHPLLYKKREDGGLVRFADTPDKIMLWNEACDELTDFADSVDLNFYYQLITRKLQNWHTRG